MRELQETNEQLSGALSHKAAEADSLRELAETVQQQQSATLQARKIMELSRKVRANIAATSCPCFWKKQYLLFEINGHAYCLHIPTVLLYADWCM